MIKKFLVFLVLNFSFVLTSFAVGVEEVFNDIDKNYKYYRELQSLYDKGIVQPDASGKFSPNSLIKRDDFIGIVSEVSCTKCIQPNVDPDLVFDFSGTKPFFDVDESNKNFYCIANFAREGVVKGYSPGFECKDGTSKAGEIPFCNQNNVTKEEALAVLLRQSSIYSLSENQKIISDIENDFITDDLALDLKPKENGVVNTFYGYFKKGLEYSLDDKYVDEFGNVVSVNYNLVKKDSAGRLNPKTFITKEDYLLMAYIIFKANSCVEEKLGTLKVDIDIYDESCVPGNTCPRADLTKDFNKLDFSPRDVKDYKYKWILRNGDFSKSFDLIYINDFDFKDNSGKVLTGNWDVTLTASDGKGNSGIAKESVNFKGLNLNLIANPTVGNFPLKVDFSVVGGKDSGKYFWKFGDGEVSYEKSPSHLYTRPGLYKAELNYSDSEGNLVKKTVNIRVTSPINNRTEAKIGEPSVDSDTGINAQIKAIQKDISSLNVDFGEILGDEGDTYTWDFGDGKTGTGKKPSHEYAATGTYTVKVTRETPDGKKVEAVIEYEVKNAKHEEINLVDGTLSQTDTDKDGVMDIDDLCPLVPGDARNDGCPILLSPCAFGNCSKGGLCNTGDSFCYPDSDGDGIDDKNDSCVFLAGENGKDCPEVKGIDFNSCAYSKTNSNIIGKASCNSCPCYNKVDFDAEIRKCDILFPAILSKDGKEIYSKGANFLNK